LSKSTGNVFPADCTPISAGKTRGLVMARLTTKKVEVEPVLVPRLAGGLAPPQYLH